MTCESIWRRQLYFFEVHFGGVWLQKGCLKTIWNMRHTLDRKKMKKHGISQGSSLVSHPKRPPSVSLWIWDSSKTTDDESQFSLHSMYAANTSAANFPISSLHAACLPELNSHSSWHPWRPHWAVVAHIHCSAAAQVPSWHAAASMHRTAGGFSVGPLELPELLSQIQQAGDPTVPHPSSSAEGARALTAWAQLPCSSGLLVLVLPQVLVLPHFNLQRLELPRLELPHLELPRYEPVTRRCCQCSVSEEVQPNFHCIRSQASELDSIISHWEWLLWSRLRRWCADV